MKASQDKCYFLSSFDISTKFFLPAYMQENSDFKTIPGVTTDRKLNFKEHVTNLCDKASRKIKHSQNVCHIYPKHKNDFKSMPVLCFNLVTVL